MRFFRNIFRRGEREDNGRQELLHLMPKGGVCAELGVWKGDFSQRILDVTSPRELHLVDPWQFQPEFPHRWYGGSAASGQIDMDAICLASPA